MILKKDFYIDYHVHPYYSLDAEGSIAEYCEKALSLGFSEVGFTPHLELDPHRKALDDKVRVGTRIVSMRSDWLSNFIEDIEKSRRIYPIELRAGVEVGYNEEIEDEIRELLSEYPFDFCLGAIHCLNHVAITDRREYELYFRNRSPRELLSNYFSVVEKAISSHLFDGIAHLDVYKKYGLRYYGDSILQMEIEFIEEALELLMKYDIALEINMAGLRTIGNPYPSASILRVAKEKGLNRVIIGSDSHKVDQFGCGIREALKLIQSTRFTLYGFKSRQPYRINYGMD